MKDGEDENEIWCLKQGNYDYEDKCTEKDATITTSNPLQTLTSKDDSSTTLSTVSILTTTKQLSEAVSTTDPIPTNTSLGTTVLKTTTEPPPPTPNITMKVKIRYEENGEVIEQEDTYNNITGEAKLVIPAHGNNTALEIVMQESTVNDKATTY